jgi:hypothetical protein
LLKQKFGYLYAKVVAKLRKVWQNISMVEHGKVIDINKNRMSKKEIIDLIKAAFKDVHLKDGIGLWQAQAIDDYADEKTIETYKLKDEKLDWQKISYQDMVQCYSSLSFFDAKGMRFCLPAFMVFDVIGFIKNDGEKLIAPDVIFTLWHKFNEPYQQERFSLFNKTQVKCMIQFLQYKLVETKTVYEKYALENYKYSKDGTDNREYKEIDETLVIWQQKLNILNT